MKRVSGKNIEECVASISKLRKWKPFEYGGEAFVAFLPSGGVFYRTKRALLNRSRKEGLSKVSILHIKP